MYPTQNCYDLEPQFLKGIAKHLLTFISNSPARVLELVLIISSISSDVFNWLDEEFSDVVDNVNLFCWLIDKLLAVTGLVACCVPPAVLPLFSIVFILLVVLTVEFLLLTFSVFKPSPKFTWPGSKSSLVRFVPWSVASIEIFFFVWLAAFADELERFRELVYDGDLTMLIGISCRSSLANSREKY